jgi:hypothetical protein
MASCSSQPAAMRASLAASSALRARISVSSAWRSWASSALIASTRSAGLAGA